MLHIYYGDGKGKTTSAIGLAVRMIGANKKVQFIQFLKDGNSSEVDVLKSIGVDVVVLDMGVYFVDMNNQESLKKVKETQEKLFSLIDIDCDCIILDEILDALLLYMLNEDTVYRFLKLYKDKKEICLTGRSASKKIVSICDYYSHVVKKKHPYDIGIPSRKGVEF